ncbi:VOC family protein [Spirosoma areae]
MKFLSLEPFIPSGNNFEGSIQFFQEVGFVINWEAGDYVGFERDGCKFILQKFDSVAFAQNLMLTVRISNADEFWREITEKRLPEKFAIRLGKPTDQPYGREVNLIDLAGVCWHFIE